MQSKNKMAELHECKVKIKYLPDSPLVEITWVESEFLKKNYEKF